MVKLHYFNITYCCDSDCMFCAANVGLIDHKGYTMKPDDVLEELRKSNVKKGDRVIINGGEPTLSPYFWQILDVCDRLGCFIDLATNGHFFADNDNVRKILKYNLVAIRIPVFGLEKQHDHLTGVQGGYGKVIIALENLSKITGNTNITVNVKFLLCKASVNSNPEVFEYLFEKYGTLFEYTLSPILVSRKAIKNKTELLLPYRELIAQSMDFIENENINCDIIPLCLLSQNKRDSILKRKKVDFKKLYNDAITHVNNMDNFQCNSCDDCRLNPFCDRFLPSYIKYFGSNEIAPF